MNPSDRNEEITSLQRQIQHLKRKFANKQNEKQIQLQEALRYLHQNQKQSIRTLLRYYSQNKLVKMMPLHYLLEKARKMNQLLFLDYFYEELRQWRKENKQQYEDFQIPVLCGFGEKYQQQVCHWLFKEFIQEAKASKMKEGEEEILVEAHQTAEVFFQIGAQSTMSKIKDQKAQQIQDTQKPQTKKKYQQPIEGQGLSRYLFQDETPDFFFVKDKKQRVSIKRFLTLDVTQVFITELREVKHTIMKHIDSYKQPNYLLDTISTLLSRYQEYYAIKQGLCEQNISEELIEQLKLYQHQYLEQTYQYVWFYGEKQSSIFKKWKEIMDKLEKYLPEMRLNFPIYSQKFISQMVGKIIDDITLYYTPCHPEDRVFTTSNENGIFINLNHIQSYQSINDYRQGPLKPYLCVCIYHEMAHRLIRQYSKSMNHQDVHQKDKKNEDLKKQAGKRDQIDHSFELASDTFGCKILKMMQKHGSEIKQVLKVRCSTTFQQKMEKSNQIINNIKAILPILSQSDQLIKKIKENFDLISKTGKKLFALAFIQQKAQQFNLSSTIWRNLTQNILQKPNEKKLDRWQVYVRKNQRSQYLFIRSLYFSQQYLNILNVKSKSQKQVEQYQQACKYLQTLSIQYFEQQNQLISSIISTIKKKYPQFFMNKHVRYFINQEFCKANMLQSLRQSLHKIYDIFKEDINAVHIFKSSAQEFHPKVNLISFLKKQYPPQSGIIDAGYIIIAQSIYQSIGRYLKFSQLYQIACQIPDFIFYEHDNGRDSGYYFEQMLFPNLLKTKKIYAKDYFYMQDLSEINAQQVGEQPQTQADKKNSTGVFRGQKDLSEKPILQMKPLTCEVSEHGYRVKKDRLPYFTQAQFASEKEYKSYLKTVYLIEKMKYEGKQIDKKAAEKMKKN